MSGGLEMDMTAHRYRVGQKVRLHRGCYWMEAERPYEVIRQLPNEDGEFGYRLKSLSGLAETFAKESELELARQIEAMPAMRSGNLHFGRAAARDGGKPPLQGSSLPGENAFRS
jgi:hypothetical protein